MITFLLDAPPSADVRTHPVARLASYHDRRYGDFAITLEDFEEWKKKLNTVFNGRVPIDPDHQADTPGGKTEAYGWITGLTLASDEHGQRVDAMIEWNDKGRDAIENKRYLYLSPTFVEHLKDEQGRDLGKALLGAGLTNRPFLRRGMPPITLSTGQAEAEGRHLLVAEQTEVESARVTDLHRHALTSKRADSHDVNPLLKKLAQALGLKEDATEETVVETAKTLAASPVVDTKKLAAALELPEDATGDKIVEKVTALTTPADPGTKTLAELAAAEGKVVLSAEQAAALAEGAAAGTEAKKALDNRDFEDGWKALSESGAVDAKPETKQLYRDIYDADKDRGLKLMASLAGQAGGAAYPAAPKGRSGATTVKTLSISGTAGNVDGITIDEDAADLDQKTLAAATGEGKELTLDAYEAELDKLEAAEVI